MQLLDCLPATCYHCASRLRWLEKLSTERSAQIKRKRVSSRTPGGACSAAFGGWREGSTDMAPGSVCGQEESARSPQAGSLAGNLTRFCYFCAERSVLSLCEQAIP